MVEGLRDYRKCRECRTRFVQHKGGRCRTCERERLGLPIRTSNNPNGRPKQPAGYQP